MSTEPMYLSDLSLPKELSKKKKLNLIFAHYVEDETKEITDLEFNKEDQLVFFTVEEAIKDEIIKGTSHLFDNFNIMNMTKTSSGIINGLMVIINIEIDAATLNKYPIRVDVHNNALNPEYDEETLSMHLSLINKNPNDYSIKIAYIKVTESEFGPNKTTGKAEFKKLNFIPVVHTV